MNIYKTKVALALTVGLAWVAAWIPSPVAQADVEPIQPACSECNASVEPGVLWFPALHPDSSCGVRFAISGAPGYCGALLEPFAPCRPVGYCHFVSQVICQGDCSNVLPAMFALGGTALPLFTPCGTNQILGSLGCGADFNLAVLVWDVTAEATAVKMTKLKCASCDG
jgi:hypothetical protein